MTDRNACLTCRFWTPPKKQAGADAPGFCRQHNEKTWASGGCGDHLYRDDRRPRRSFPKAMTISSETLAQELKRLVGEYQDPDAGDATKEEAWHVIADWAIENAPAVIGALSALQALQYTGDKEP